MHLAYHSTRLGQRGVDRLPRTTEVSSNRRHRRAATRHLDGELLLGWRELRLAATGPPACPCCSQPCQHPVTNQVPFEFGKGREDAEEQLTLTRLRGGMRERPLKHDKLDLACLQFIE